MPDPYAKVIGDSIATDCPRLTTVEVGGWRPVLAEFNTHRWFSRNSASSRARPVTKILDLFDNDFMYPAEWGAERPGMQQGPPLEGPALYDARELWDDLRTTVSQRIHQYLDAHPLEEGSEPRIHKGLLNRWMEVGLQQVMIVSATQWDGFFWQRCHEHADQNIRLMAEAIQDAMAKSTPKALEPGEYHKPYFADQGGFDDDWDRVIRLPSVQEGEEDAEEIAKRISAGRCARVSHVNQSGIRDITDDLRLYVRLADRSDDPTNPPHASPLEHVATPWPKNQQMITIPTTGKTMGPLPRLGNFVGWLQMRHEELAF